MANRMVKTQIDTTAGQITWSFPGTELAPVVLAIASVSEKNKARAMYHGFNQRVSDNAADAKTPSAKRDGILAIVTHLTSGTDEWELTRRVGPRPFDSGAVIAAMARVLFASDVDKANRMADAVAAKRGIAREEALKLFAADERVAADMARAKAASNPSKIDVDAELAMMEHALIESVSETPVSEEGQAKAAEMVETLTEETRATE